MPKFTFVKCRCKFRGLDAIAKGISEESLDNFHKKPVPPKSHLLIWFCCVLPAIIEKNINLINAFSIKSSELGYKTLLRVIFRSMS